MEYSPLEKQVLQELKKTDFRRLSKNDIVSVASKINELRPEVAEEVLAQYPEYVELVKHSVTEYKDILDRKAFIYDKI